MNIKESIVRLQDIIVARSLTHRDREAMREVLAEIERLQEELADKQDLLDQWELLLGRKMRDALPDELAAEAAGGVK